VLFLGEARGGEVHTCSVYGPKTVLLACCSWVGYLNDASKVEGMHCILAMYMVCVRTHRSSAVCSCGARGVAGLLLCAVGEWCILLAL
jgi:hypothetical protein